MGITSAPGRVCRTTTLGDATLVTVNTAEGPIDLLAPATPDQRGAEAGAAGLRRLQWVRLHLSADVPFARLAGTTRHPQVRTLTLGAGLALAERGVPAYVVGEGS